MGGSDVKFLDYVTDNPVPADVIDRAMAHWQSLAPLRGPVGAWPMERGERGNNHTFRLTKDEWQAVLRTARRIKVTPYVYVLTMFQMAITRFTGGDGYIINGTIHDRPDPETIGMIGCFDSFIVMRGGVPPTHRWSPSSTEIWQRVQETVDVGAAVPASLSGPDAEGRLPYVASVPSVEFAMFETRDGLDLPGVRQRRFRLGVRAPGPPSHLLPGVRRRAELLLLLVHRRGRAPGGRCRTSSGASSWGTSSPGSGGPRPDRQAGRLKPERSVR